MPGVSPAIVSLGTAVPNDEAVGSVQLAGPSVAASLAGCASDEASWEAEPSLAASAPGAVAPFPPLEPQLVTIVVAMMRLQRMATAPEYRRRVGAHGKAQTAASG